MTFGLPRRHYRICDSTNERARALAEDGAPAGTVITAEQQRAGRGRQGRRWIAPPGKALLYSAILRPLSERHGLLPLAVGLAVADSIEALSESDAQVKWPNDIWIGGRKCAGVLIEAQPTSGWAVIGVGLNLGIERDAFPPELRDSATSIGQGVTYAAALGALNERLDEWVEAKTSSVLQAFSERDALHGQRVSWERGEGIADGVDEAGNLLVSLPSGERVRLGAGEVHLAPIGAR